MALSKISPWFYQSKVIQIAILITIMSCSSSVNSDKSLLPSEDYYEVALDMNHVSAYSISDFFGLDSMVFLETKPDFLIGEISGLIFKNNKIYILDDEQRQILAYSSQGKIAGKINDLGKGPLEYTEISDFDIFKDKLFLSDPNDDTFLQYDANDLSPVKKINELGNIASFVMLEEDRLFGYAANSYNSYTKVSNDTYNNVFFRSFSSIEGSFLPFHSSHVGRIYACGPARSRIVQYDEDYFYYDQPRLTAYKVHKSGNLSAYFKVLGRSAEFSEATMPNKEFRKKLTQRDAPALLNNLNIQEDFIYYQFIYNKAGYKGLFFKETGKNILFKIGKKDDYFGVSISMIPYKGENHGLVGFLQPYDFFNSDKGDPYEASKIKSSLKGIQSEDNPILVFMSLKENLSSI